MKRLLLLILFCSQVVGANGQEAPQQPVLPPGPWPTRTAPMSAWEIQCTATSSTDISAPSDASSGETGSPNGPLIPAFTTFHVTKTGSVIHEIQSGSNGKTWDKWFKNGLEITATSGETLFMICNAPSPIFFHDYNHSDFENFYWLSKSNYQGTEVINGQNCFWFKARVMSVNEGIPKVVANDRVPTCGAERIFEVKAYLDVKTLLPVQLNWDNQKWTYQFLTPPEAMQEFPAKFQTALNEELKKERVTAPARPY